MLQELIRARFASLEAKLIFDKATEINKKIIIEKGLEFGEYIFPSVTDKMVVLGWR